MRLGAVVGLLCVLGCVDDGSSGTPAGSLGGICYPDNGCDPGLVCVLTSGKALCEVPDATATDAAADAPADQTVADGPSLDGGADASDASSCIADAERPCPTHDAGVGCTYCCADNDTCGLNFSSCSGHSWNCRSNANCGGGLCCLNITVTNTSSCPEQVTAGNTVCSDAGASCGASKSLCVTSAECDGGKCQTVLVAGMTTPIGVCM